jgi:hypothetical protein
MSTWRQHCSKCRIYQGKAVSDKNWGKFPPKTDKCKKCGAELGWRSNDCLSGIFSVPKPVKKGTRRTK